MPPHDRLRANEGDAATDTWKQPIDPDKKETIQNAQSKTLGHLPAKNVQLMAKDQDLGLKANP